jgi:Protein of unknown function (DUF1580)
MKSQLLNEELVSLADLAPSMPHRGGRPPHLTTLARWIVCGVRGPNGNRVQLEAIRCGGSWRSSLAAVERFFAALTPVNNVDQIAPRTTGQRQRASERAAKELEAMGV